MTEQMRFPHGLALQVYQDILHYRIGVGCPESTTGVNLLEVLEGLRREAISKGEEKLVSSWQNALLWMPHQNGRGCWRLTGVLDAGGDMPLEYVIVPDGDPATVRFVDATLVKRVSLPAHQDGLRNLIPAANRFVRACVSDHMAAKQEHPELSDSQVLQEVYETLYKNPTMYGRALDLCNASREIAHWKTLAVVGDTPKGRDVARASSEKYLEMWLTPSLRSQFAMKIPPSADRSVE
ncbi:MAG: hypothetical protein ACP5OR_01935 [Candidatus Dormibacteria bacterium]